MDFPTGLTTKELKRRGRQIPLNCVDKCLLALDGINEPVTTYAILDLEGTIDPIRLNQAILSAQRAHPRMRTLLRRKRLRLFREVKEDLRGGVLAVQDLASLQGATYERCLFEFLNRRIDIRKELPFRVLLLRKNEGECSLIFTFHHSAVDGLRALLFVRRIIESYNDEVSKDSQSSEDARIYSKKDELLEYANSQRSRVKHYYVKMFSYLFHRFVIDAFPLPTRVFHDRSGGSKDIDHYARNIDPTELELIGSKAASAAVELNDILLAACFRVVEKWNSMHGKASNRIRIMAPVNLSPKGFRNVVSNQASWLSLSTRPEDRADPAKLLRKVRADTVNAALNRRAFSLVYFFYFCSRFPLMVVRGMCRFLMITRTYVDTILITNLGLTWSKVGSDEPAVTNIGDSRIVNITGSTAVVTPMGFSICIGIYNKNLSISVAYRPALFSRGKMQEFLHLYAEEIKNYQVGPQGS